jgi:Rrf2 family protein
MGLAMIFSRSVECAFRGIVELSRMGSGVIAKADELARSTGLPAPFLSKTLQRCARAGWLSSTKGPAGGFSLSVRKDRLSLYDVALEFDGPDRWERCPFCGRSEEAADGCSPHDGWRELCGHIVEWMQGMTVGGAVRSTATGQPAPGRKKRPPGAGASRKLRRR